MAITAKLTIESAKLSVYPSEAVGQVRYFIDAGGTGALDTRVISSALNTVPKIGSTKDFYAVPGAPAVRFSLAGVGGTTFSNAPNNSTQQIFNLRLTEQHVSFANNTQKMFIDLVYRSRQAASIEYDSSLTQKAVSTYLFQRVEGTSINDRKQMVVSYTKKAGTDGPNTPPEDWPKIKAPITDSVLRFGASIRVCATFYADEISDEQFKIMQKKYCECTNFDDFIFPGDTQLWICSNISATSSDGGYTKRISAELVYNLDGWDTVAVYTDSFTGTNAILSDDVISTLYQPLEQRGAGTPISYTTGNGGARFAQHNTADLSELYWGILGGAENTASLKAMIGA